MRANAIAPVLALVLAACGHGHDHGQEESGHGHGHGHGHGAQGHAEEGPEPVALTLFTNTHQMFVELDAPIAGKASGFHAHVTRLADHQPATAGSLTVEWLRGGAAVTKAVADKVARAGIFTPELMTPPEPGEYTLRMTFAHEAERAVWEAGPFKLGPEPATAPEAPEEGDITFLMEAQWKIPFGLGLPEERPVARPLPVPAVIAPDPARSRPVAATSAGRVDWVADGRPIVVGTRVRAGETIGRLVPAAAGEHPSTLEATASQARIELARARDEKARLKGLVADGLVPASRLRDAEAAEAQAAAALKGASTRLGQVRGAAAPGIPVVAPVDGVVVEQAVAHGALAEAGATLALVADDAGVLVRGRLFGRETPRPDEIREVRLRRGGEQASVTLERAALLNAASVADPVTQTTPVDVRVDNPERRLRFGEAVELTLAVGEEKPYLTVPRDAVVEINTRPYIFVMNSGESFSRRAVRLGPADAERVAILEGIAPADRIVVRGAFDVYVASLAGTVESHQH